MYFLDFRYEQTPSIHDHDTRCANLIGAKLTRMVMAQNCIRHHSYNIELHPRYILEQIDMHSLQGFTLYTQIFHP